MSDDLRSSVLKSLPSDTVAYDVEAPAPESGEVDICRAVVKIERLVDEALAPILCGVPEAFQLVAWSIKRRFR